MPMSLEMEQASGQTSGAGPGNAPVHRAGRDWPWAGIVAGVVIFLFALFLLRHWGPAISEPDDNGYYAQGSLLARTGESYFRRESDAQYIGMHWLLMPQGTFISRYPPGLAAAIAAVYVLAGWRASVLVNPLLAVLGLVGMYLLTR